MKGFGHGVSSGFFIILALGLLIFGRSNHLVVEKSRSAVFNVFVPVLDVLARPFEVADDFMDWVERLAIAFSENNRLREENTRLRQVQITASQLAIDNQRLKKLLNIKEGSLTNVAASRVVSDSGSPFVKSVLINSGFEDGVRKGQAVMNEEGIIGRTITVGTSSARVLLVTDINSRIPVKMAASGFNMILEGDNSSDPKLSFLPLGKQIALGDVVLTSGFGKIFPPDLPVGQVIEISEDNIIRVRLAANMRRLNYVTILNYDIAKNLNRLRPPPPEDKGQN